MVPPVCGPMSLTESEPHPSQWLDVTNPQFLPGPLWPSRGQGMVAHTSWLQSPCPPTQPLGSSPHPDPPGRGDTEQPTSPQVSLMSVPHNANVRNYFYLQARLNVSDLYL